MSTLPGAQMMGQVNVPQLGELCILGDIYVAMSGDMFGWLWQFHNKRIMRLNVPVILRLRNPGLRGWAQVVPGQR